MAKIVGVRFKNAGKLYYFDPGKLWPSAGSDVIVETIRGVDFGQVITGVREVDDSLIEVPLRPVIRIATEEDARHKDENEAFNREAFQICLAKIEEHKLEMKLVGVEQTFDNAKILFYFTANGRVDFRSLVKDLAGIFHTRIELRQIGVRDEAKMLGGLGPCGRPICCGSFLGDFQPVSIKMAKEQSLSLNPTKISGVCGRLMCCLKFEEDQYENIHRRMPRIGKDVETPDGIGSVADISVLKETVKVRIHKGDSFEYKIYPLADIKWQKSSHWSENDDREDRREPVKASRPVISSDPEGRQNAADSKAAQNHTADEPLETYEEATRPVEQSNAWLKAVEDALRATSPK